MRKFSSLFNRHKDVKLKGSSDDKEEDASPHGQEGLYDSTRPNQSPPRLARSPIIRRLRHPDDVDLSGIPPIGMDQTFVLAPGSCSPSPSNRLSRYLSKFKMVSPPPSPPRSPVQFGIQSSPQWPPPSPRQSPRGNQDNEKFLSDLPSSDTGLLQGDTYILQQSTIDTEDLQRLPSHLPTQSSAKFDQTCPGSSVEAAASSTQGLQFRNAKGEGGGDLHIYIHVNHVQQSTPSSRFSSPVPSPQELGTQKDPWLWNSASGHPQQAPSGHNLMTNDFSSPEYPHDDGVDYALSRDIGHPLPYPQTIGTPTGLPSPPRSPRAASPGSPMRAESEPSAGKWQKGHLLGSGAFGKVYKGIHSETGEFCAIKEVEFNQDDSKSKESAKQLVQEIALLSSFYHPNIVQYKGSELVSDSLYIYLELMSGGSLCKLCQEFKLEVPVIRRYTRQILLGLQFLHSRNIVHSE